MLTTKFTDFLTDRFGPRWAVCRKTPRNLERYGRCLTRKEYQTAQEDFICRTGPQWRVAITE